MTNKKLWHYNGAFYKNGTPVGNIEIYTAAGSYREARKNTIWTIKKIQKFSIFAHVDIDAAHLHCEETVIVKSRKSAKRFFGNQPHIFPKMREE